MVDRVPQVSVITTLLYPRLRPLDCLKSWTTGQDFRQEDIELIIVVNGRRAALEKQVTAIMRPQDRLVFVDSRNEMALYDAGARAAQGQWLMFTEPHCVAQADCLSELLVLVRAKELAGACVRTLPTEEPSRTALMEARMYLEDAEIWTRENDWRKFTKRGTLVRREAYLQTGGFDAEQLRFSEITLAAKLHHAGHRLGFAPRAAITHYNSPDLLELLSYVWEYRRMEKRVAATHPGLLGEKASVSCDPQLNEALKEPWLRERLRKLLEKKLKRGMTDEVVKAIRGSLGGLGESSSWRRYCDHGLQALKTAGRAAAALRSFYRPGQSEDCTYAAYKRVWLTFGELSLALDREKSPMTSVLSDPSGEWSMTSSQGCHFSGLHGVEKHKDQAFRWTGAVAIFRFASGGEIPRVTLEILQVRALKTKEVAVFWNQARLTFDKVESTPARWIFFPKNGSGKPPSSNAGSVDTLMIFCHPLPANRNDPRVLGLPLVSMKVQPIRMKDSV
ncbi:hypothetical protein BH11VER1_BH11VER1_01690 [soil metagenome]